MYQSTFDKMMVEADEALMDAFATEHPLTLSNDFVLPLRAIFDTKLVSNIRGKSIFKEMKNGILTVHNKRLDKELYQNAVVLTVLGPRLVSEIIYPEEHSTILILSSLDKSQKLTSDYF